MRRNLTSIVVSTLGALLCCVGNACAADQSGADAAMRSPAKGQYSLLNPTPDDLLRGMDTDRPNKTNTPHTIDAGHVQIETGFVDFVHYRNHYQGADATTDSLALGHVNLRIGVLDNLEINAAIDSYDFLWSKDHLANQSSRQHGFGDTIVGGKLSLWGNEGGDEVWSTGLALQPQLKLPTARRDLGNGHTEWFLGVPFVVTLPADFHLGLQTTVSRERDLANSRDVTGWQNSVSVDRVFFGFDVYVEYWSHVSTEHHRQAQHTADIGFVYPLTDSVTLDVGTVFGLNKASNTVEGLAGMSARF